jgi:hypothetical protein
MKMSELRPCDNCGGVIAPMFYVVRFSIALFKKQAVNEVMGMTQYFGGALDLAEMFVGDDEVVRVAMDDQETKMLRTELYICQECYLMKPLHLAVLAEKVNERSKKKGENDEHTD